MSEDSGQEKTEQPTPKRLEDARKKGQVPRSRELNTMALLMASAAAFLFLGGSMLDGLKAIFIHSLSLRNIQLMTASSIERTLGDRPVTEFMDNGSFSADNHVGYYHHATGYWRLVIQYGSSQF